MIGQRFVWNHNPKSTCGEASGFVDRLSSRLVGNGAGEEEVDVLLADRGDPAIVGQDQWQGFKLAGQHRSLRLIEHELSLEVERVSRKEAHCRAAEIPLIANVQNDATARAQTRPVQ